MDLKECLFCKLQQLIDDENELNQVKEMIENLLDIKQNDSVSEVYDILQLNCENPTEKIQKMAIKLEKDPLYDIFLKMPEYIKKGKKSRDFVAIVLRDVKTPYAYSSLEKKYQMFVKQYKMEQNILNGDKS